MRCQNLKRLLSAVLFSMACVFPCFAGQKPITITLGLGDSPEEITRKSPELRSYMGELKNYFGNLDKIIEDESQSSASCKQNNSAINNKKVEAGDCAEFDTPSVEEPGMTVDGLLFYKDKKHNFRIRNLQLLRLRGVSGVSEIRAELRPNFKDVHEIVHHFNDFKTEVINAVKEMDASGMPRLHDSTIKHNTKLDDHIFTVDNLFFDLKNTQLTDEHRTRCGGHYEWLLGAWADEEIFALLVLTGMQNEFEIIGESFATNVGYRLAIIIAPNEQNQTEKVREANWRSIFYPTDELQLPLADRSSCYKESANPSFKRDRLKSAP